MNLVFCEVQKVGNRWHRYTDIQVVIKITEIGIIMSGVDKSVSQLFF